MGIPRIFYIKLYNLFSTLQCSFKEVMAVPLSLTYNAALQGE